MTRPVQLFAARREPTPDERIAQLEQAVARLAASGAEARMARDLIASLQERVIERLNARLLLVEAEVVALRGGA